ncbi:MAG TPA: cell division protein FtsQ/DivIB [Casimicrobiaceae bacterium]|nr:cell division protein FtsQ/DivIB [Casimicrobiaceae bacterium]
MWDDARQLNAIAVTLVVIALAFLTWALVGWVTRLSAFEYRNIIVTTPLNRTSGTHLEAVIRSELRGTFFTMDLNAARESLARVPWVRTVALRRQWPRTLEIDVDEHQPLARWNDGALVSTRGDVFTANYAGDLPEFRGPDDQSRLMVERYREWGALLEPLALRLSGLRLSARGGWQLQTRDDRGELTLDVGRDDVAGRLTRFVAVYARTVGVLARTGKPVDHVDLRYRNGFAARMPEFREKPARKLS